MSENKQPIDVGKDFYYRLIYRDERLGDRKHNAREFRRRFLKEYDCEDVWKRDPKPIVFDFKNVKTIGPSFASEAFAHFTQYATPEQIRKIFLFVNISFVHKTIIDEEIDSGYSSRT